MSTFVSGQSYGTLSPQSDSEGWSEAGGRKLYRERTFSKPPPPAPTRLTFSDGENVHNKENKPPFEIPSSSPRIRRTPYPFPNTNLMPLPSPPPPTPTSVSEAPWASDPSIISLAFEILVDSQSEVAGFALEEAPNVSMPPTPFIDANELDPCNDSPYVASLLCTSDDSLSEASILSPLHALQVPCTSMPHTPSPSKPQLGFDALSPLDLDLQNLSLISSAFNGNVSPLHEGIGILDIHDEDDVFQFSEVKATLVRTVTTYLDDDTLDCEGTSGHCDVL
ncbi:hypothetical protein HGRIS_001886 [Hohenbuehelia grisea]|uniref:Uncharacterized protein n=1 Tax=Hohenbuehelia grisea TaxID=104357 RepID=A0ABR3JJ76_9AGAR